MGGESANAGAAKSPPWQQDQEGGESFGAWLKKHRQGRSIDLKEIAEHTKISLGTLQALEEDDSDALPARVFVRGFLRQYARFVGLDPEEVVTLYAGSHPSVEDEALRVRNEGGDDSDAWVWIAVAVLLAAAAAGYWFFGRSQAAPEDPPPAETVVEAQEQQPERVVTPPTDQADQTAAKQEAGDPADEIEPDADGPPEPAQPAAAELPAGTELAATPFHVTIDFVEDCWVESTVDGERQISTLYAKGESLRLEAADHVRVFLGNYSGAVVQVNGRPYSWPDGPAGDDTRELEVDADFIAAMSNAGEQSQGPNEQASFS